MERQPLRCAACGSAVMMFDPPLDVGIDMFGGHYVEARDLDGVIIGCRARARELDMIE